MKTNFGSKLERRINEIEDEQAHEVGIALRKKARELTPEDSGNLRKAIRMSARKREKSIYVYVDYSKTINKKTGFNYGRWIFEGEPSPILWAHNSKYMIFRTKRSNGRPVFAKKVVNPVNYRIFEEAKKQVLAERKKRG